MQSRYHDEGPQRQAHGTMSTEPVDDDNESSRLIYRNQDEDLDGAIARDEKDADNSTNKWTLIGSMPLIGEYLRLSDKYNSSLLNIFGWESFIKGGNVLVTLAMQDLFKAYFKMGPSSSQALQASLLLPWSLKLFMGLVSDNIPILGSYRKSYLIISSLFMALSMLMMGVIGQDNKTAAIWLLAIFQTSFAFADLVREALMVSAARKDT